MKISIKELLPDESKLMKDGTRQIVFRLTPPPKDEWLFLLRKWYSRDPNRDKGILDASSGEIVKITTVDRDEERIVRILQTAMNKANKQFEEHERQHAEDENRKRQKADAARIKHQKETQEFRDRLRRIKLKDQ